MYSCSDRLAAHLHDEIPVETKGLSSSMSVVIGQLDRFAGCLPENGRGQYPDGNTMDKTYFFVCVWVSAINKPTEAIGQTT